MLPVTAALLLLAGTLIAAHYAKLLLSRGRYPPGPTPLPIIGNLWTLRFELRYEMLMKLAKTYGNVFTVWLGQTPVVVLNGCKALRNGLITHSEALSGRPTTPVTEELSKGKGVIFTAGHTWKQQRRFGIMAMRNLGLGKQILEERIQKEAKWLLETFTIQKGTAMDPSPAIIHSTTKVISAVVFGRHFSPDDKELKALLESINIILKFVATIWARLVDAFPWLMQWFPGPHKDCFMHNQSLERFARKEIRIHKEIGIPEDPQNLIDLYMMEMSRASKDVNSTYDEDNMIHLALDLFVAGTETTAVTLRWCLLYMVNHPEIQEKVQTELDTVLGDSQTIQYEDRKRLPYTNAVIHEIQRCSNVASIGLFRQTVKEAWFEDLHIEKGTIVIANLPSSMHDPAHWEAPHQFHPSHFLDTDGNFVSNDAFLVFSAGHRVCLGELLARIELFIFFTSLLRAFTFRLPKGVTEVNMDYVFGSTLQPHPYEICAVPR